MIDTCCNNSNCYFPIHVVVLRLLLIDVHSRGSSGTASHVNMAASPSAASMLRNASEKDMGNGDVHKVTYDSLVSITVA